MDFSTVKVGDVLERHPNPPLYMEHFKGRVIRVDANEILLKITEIISNPKNTLVIGNTWVASCSLSTLYTQYQKEVGEFSPGDRVSFEDEGIGYGTFVGFTYDTDRKWALVIRDDGYRGSGPNQEYCFYPNFLTKVSSAPAPIDNSHIAGLSPERVDWDKVMRGKWE